MELLNALSFAAVASLLVMSPGPNGVLIAKTVATSGKAAGFANVAGFVAAFHFHGALSILGISAVLLASSNVFLVVKMLGAAYLCWIGFKALRDAFFSNNASQQAETAKHTTSSDTSRVFVKEVDHSSLLSADEEKLYARLAQKGDEKAREKLFECSLTLVEKIAKRYISKGLRYTELVEAGKAGLNHAIENYVPDSGVRFSTYATECIRQKIEKALLIQTRNLHLPSHMMKELNIYLMAERRLQQKMDKVPTAGEIAAECEKPVADVKRMLVLRDRISSVEISPEPEAGPSLPDSSSSNNKPKAASKLSAFIEGFLTNVLNPKTSMFYLAAFPQFITIGDGAAVSAYILVLLHTIINVAWFGTMVVLFAHLARFSMRESFQRWLKGITGIVFIGFGVKLATY